MKFVLVPFLSKPFIPAADESSGVQSVSIEFQGKVEHVNHSQENGFRVPTTPWSESDALWALKIHLQSSIYRGDHEEQNGR